MIRPGIGRSQSKTLAVNGISSISGTAIRGLGSDLKKCKTLKSRAFFLDLWL